MSLCHNCEQEEAIAEVRIEHLQGVRQRAQIASGQLGPKCLMRVMRQMGVEVDFPKELMESSDSEVPDIFDDLDKPKKKVAVKKCRRPNCKPRWTCRTCRAKCCEHMCSLKNSDSPEGNVASCMKCQAAR